MLGSTIGSRPALEPTPAITGLLDLFATHQLVALGEMHVLQDEADFIAALLHHPAFPATVQVIVYEIGNARHQAVVDRFIAGEPVFSVLCGATCSVGALTRQSMSSSFGA